ncbi:hypothetical protein IMZ48_08975 [Candidatus Bathyarchaeota archaeon]|nr:hypothetical protein [Candidatus Bathyarchaeota archaeon]
MDGKGWMIRYSMDMVCKMGPVCSSNSAGKKPKAASPPGASTNKREVLMVPCVYAKGIKVGDLREKKRSGPPSLVREEYQPEPRGLVKRQARGINKVESGWVERVQRRRR